MKKKFQFKKIIFYLNYNKKINNNRKSNINKKRNKNIINGILSLKDD